MASLYKITLILIVSILICYENTAEGHFVPSLPGPPPNQNLLRYFYFPTPETSVEIIFNNTDSLLASGLKEATKTIILLDGFTCNLTSFMNTETKNSFAATEEVNLILVDWSYYNGNKYPIAELIDIILAYVSAMYNVSPAGDNLANFFNFLRIHKQIEFSNITVVSHSLGCHAAGAAGRATKDLFGASIGRIVGLDPALQFTDLEAPVRLQIGDASVVEIYHTARQTIGDIFPATGDITIYPNGGENQPCEETGTPGGGGCNNHSFSWKLYNCALTNTTIKACPCKGAACFCHECSYECGDDAVNIGPFIPEEARGSYHVKTGFLRWD